MAGSERGYSGRRERSSCHAPRALYAFEFGSERRMTAVVIDRNYATGRRHRLRQPECPMPAELRREAQICAPRPSGPRRPVNPCGLLRVESGHGQAGSMETGNFAICDGAVQSST